MKLFGFEITRAKKALNQPYDRGWTTIWESYAGAWQQNVTVDVTAVPSHPIVWSCATLIAGDIGKLALRLMRKRGQIWVEEENPAYSPVLRRPNGYQLRQSFVEHWMLSKLFRGNSYALKERDARGVVRALHVLHPDDVQPLIAPSGDVFYQLRSNDLAKLGKDIPAAPASEIIHDRWNCLYHPLLGVSPIYAAGVAATAGLKIGENATNFFGNQARPNGILTAPGQIADETAKRLKEHWETEYGGSNAGKKVAVLGDGLKWEPLTMTAVDAELVKQAEMTDKAICAAFHVPGHKVGVGPMPTHDNIEAFELQYYGQCLQPLIESFEAHLDDGLSLASDLCTEFDLEGLLRMDTPRKVDAAQKMVGAGFLSPNEARERFGLTPVTGGDTPYMQQQNYSLEALAKRDAKDPLADPGPNPQSATPEVEENEDDEDVEMAFAAEVIRWKAVDEYSVA